MDGLSLVVIIATIIFFKKETLGFLEDLGKLILRGARGLFNILKNKE